MQSYRRNSVRPEESEAWPGVVHPSVPVPGVRRIRQGAGLARLILAFVGLLLLSLHQSCDYTVKAGGGGEYTTIQTCANATVAGDTCTVYAGTYNEDGHAIALGTAPEMSTNPASRSRQPLAIAVIVYGFSINLTTRLGVMLKPSFTITDTYA